MSPLVFDVLRTPPSNCTGELTLVVNSDLTKILERYGIIANYVIDVSGASMRIFLTSLYTDDDLEGKTLLIDLSYSIGSSSKLVFDRIEAAYIPSNYKNLNSAPYFKKELETPLPIPC